MLSKFLFAIDSCNNGQAHSTGWSWGEYGGSGYNIIFSGMISDFREWNHAWSISKIITVSVSLSFLAFENSSKAILIISFDTLGKIRNSLSQVSGWTNQ